MKLKITVHGVAYEVEVEVLDPGEGFATTGPLPPVAGAARPAPRHLPVAPPTARGSAPATPASAAAGSQGVVSSPIAGTVVEVRCREGETVVKGQVLLVVDAMKMNTSIASPAPGTVRKVLVAAGDTVREGETLVELD